MNKYAWRNNCTAIFIDHERTICGKLAFKTKEKEWLETKSPVIALISIHSSFHEDFGGDLKMDAFMATIKSYVKGKITVLIADQAHLHTLSLCHANSLEKALQESRKAAERLKERYHPYFENCTVVYWHDYISHDPQFLFKLALMKNLYQNDLNFQKLVQKDAEVTYTPERMKKHPNKILFMEKAIEDILEQCVCVLVLASKGYKFQFYPGKPCESTDYVKKTLLPSDRQISWIDVFLTIEKKVIKISA